MTRHSTHYQALKSFVLIVFVLCTHSVTAQIITTIAGGGNGDGGLATNVSIAPGFVFFDGSGNLYITDEPNNLIRRVDATSGIITTLAGSGTQGYSGDGGAATNAELNYPTSAVVDAFGNIYIADMGNNVIRRVDASSGIITTVAGNGTYGYTGDGEVATNATLNSPYGVSVDAFGNVFIADAANNVIRRVDANTGVITTVAGNGISGYSGDGAAAASASINFPIGIMLDGSGNIYIADFNNVIRRVDKSTAVITTMAGNGTNGYGGDGGTATSAQLSFPKNVTLDGSGNLYIADTGNNRIRKVDAINGIITTVAGNGVPGYSGDGGAATDAQFFSPSCVAINGSGDLFVADDARVRRVDAGTGTITTVAGNGMHGYSSDGGPATNAQLYSSMGIALDSEANIYIADTNLSQICRVDAGSGIITVVAGNGTQGFSGDGGAATNAQISSPIGLAIDGTGNIYIADKDNHRVRRVDASTGIITTVAGNGVSGFSGDGGIGTNAQLNYPFGIALDGAGNLYIADTFNNAIRRVDGTTGIITTAAGNGMAVYIGDGGPATNARLNNPYGVAVDASGNLDVDDFANQRIRHVDANTGIITTVAGNGSAGYNGDNEVATGAQLTDPTGVAVDYAGNIYIADAANNRIRMVARGTGTITTIAGNGSSGFSGDGEAANDAQLNDPFAVTLDGNGNIYIADWDNHRIRKVTRQPQSISFSELPDKTYGDFDFFLNATASSDLPVNYESSNTDVATIAGNTLVIVGGGTTTITATQAGNTTYAAATVVMQPLVVHRATQTIHFGSMNAVVFGASFTLGAKASSGLTISYASSNTDVAVVSGDTLITVGAGTTTITASQPGNNNYTPATSVTQALIVNKAIQTIEFDPLSTLVLGDPPIAISAKASSGLLVSFTSSDTTIAKVSGTMITLLKAGKVTITASQPGNNNYTPAADVTQTSCVNPAKPSIIESGANTASPTLASNSDSGNEWFLNGTAITNAVADTLSITKSGTYSVQVRIDNCVSLMSDPQVLVITGDILSHEAQNMILYPNPAKNTVVISMKNFPPTESLSVSVYDVTGRTMPPINSVADNTITLDVSSYARGVYIIKALQQGKVFTALFVKE